MTSTPDTKDSEKAEPQNLERYRIRYGLYKVIFGSCIVGLAGVLVPGAIQFWQLKFEDRRSRLESAAIQARQQQLFLKDFVDTALNQDIELRIRFAEYFSYLSPPPFNNSWQKYRNRLQETRDDTRSEIHDKERDVRRLLQIGSPTLTQQIEAEKLRRQLEWRYKEIGYLQRDRSAVSSQTESSDVGIRTSLRETRKTLRLETLTANRPLLTVNSECIETMLKLQDPEAPYPLSSHDVSKCALEPASGDGAIKFLLGASDSVVLEGASEFVELMEDYAEALRKIVEANDEHSLAQAIVDLPKVVKSVARSGSIIADGGHPITNDRMDLGGDKASYDLETRRADVLKAIATAVQPWIEKSSKAAVLAMRSAQAEIVLGMRDDIFKQIDRVNEASTSTYLEEVEKAIAANDRLQEELSKDWGASLRLLPSVHQRWIETLNEYPKSVPVENVVYLELLDTIQRTRKELGN